jgi:hypothetical protein
MDYGLRTAMSTCQTTNPEWAGGPIPTFEDRTPGPGGAAR